MNVTMSKPEVVYTPPPPPKSLKPSWWRTFFKPTGTIVRHNGILWELTAYYSWGDYCGRGWEPYAGDIDE